VSNLYYNRPKERRKLTDSIEKLLINTYKDNPKLAIGILDYFRDKIELPTGQYRRAALTVLSSICHIVVIENPEDISFVLEVIYKVLLNPDPKIRFAGCEAMYNILNTCRTKLIGQLCSLWKSIIKVLIAISNS